METDVAVIPDDAHLDRYLEYPRRAHPVVKACFVSVMEDGLVIHLDRALPSMCVFRRTGVDVDDRAAAWQRRRPGADSDSKPSRRADANEPP